VKITIEETLFVCIILNFLIIKVSGFILKEEVQNGILSSLLGGEISILAPRLFSFWASKILVILLTLCIITLISFKISSFFDFFRDFFVILASTFVFGGGVLAVQNVVGSFPIFIVSLVGGVIYLALFITLKSVQHKNRINGFCYEVSLKDNGNEVIEEGFLDSGNMLYDSITKQPVILVSYEVFHKLYKDISFSSVIAKTFDKCSIKNGHYIKINSIGSGTSMLVFTVDEVLIGKNKRYKDAMVGLSLSGFEKSFGKNVLLHSDLV